MISLLTVIAIGFFLGMRHATDPDHVVAITTIVSREGSARRSALIGAAWGIGHTVTILAVGGAIILFRITLPPRLGLGMEFAVALMLIILGIKNLNISLAWRTPVLTRLNTVAAAADEGTQVHTHDHSCLRGAEHHHHHSHSTGTLDRWFGELSLYRYVRPLIVGVVHGMAGSAAIALLVLSTIPGTFSAIAYLLVFGLGTVLSMMLITRVIAGTVAYGQHRFTNLGHRATWAAGLVSFAFGVFLAYHIGFVDGLFRSHVNWIPR